MVAAVGFDPIEEESRHGQSGDEALLKGELEAGDDRDQDRFEDNPISRSRKLHCLERGPQVE